jgi:hypothetical protein
MNKTEMLLFGILIFVLLILVVNVLYNMFSDNDTYLSWPFRRRRRHSSYRHSSRRGGDERDRERHRRR